MMSAATSAPSRDIDREDGRPRPVFNDGYIAQGVHQLQPRHVEHQDRVLGLADRLRADGIDAEVDQYNPSPPEGWPLWCERQIEAADVVLMVCTEIYNRRVRGDEEQGKGLGVTWEARIIRQFLYDAGALSDKFVPVLFSHTSPGHIPTPIKGGNWYVVDTAQGYEELYRRLTKQPSLLRRPIGSKSSSANLRPGKCDGAFT